MSLATQSDLLKAYLEIPSSAYRFICDNMNYSHVTSLINLLKGKNRCSEEKLNIVFGFYEYWKTTESFSFFNLNGSFDQWQHAAYLKGLTDLINSPDYLLLSSIKRSKILKEQNNISKELWKYFEQEIK